MATIIRHESQHSPSGTMLHGVAYNLADLAGEAEGMLGDVRTRAAGIIQQAEQDAAEIRQRAEAEGQQAAEAAIERILDEKVAQQMKTLSPALAGAISQIEDSKQEWLQHWENSAVGLAMAMAQRLVRREMARSPEIATEWVREALELAAGSSEITIRLNPQDEQTIARQVEQLANEISPLATARIVPDAAISLGGCRLETAFGSIDQQLETQLDRIREELS